MINSQLKPRVNDDILWRKDGLGNEIVVLASCLGGPIRFLNPVASSILEFSNGQNTVDSIIKKVLKNYENADKKQVEKDVISFLIVLKENKIIEYQ